MYEDVLSFLLGYTLVEASREQAVRGSLLIHNRIRTISDFQSLALCRQAVP